MVKGGIFKKEGISYDGDWKEDKYNGHGVYKYQKDTRNEGGFLVEKVQEKYQKFSCYNLYFLKESDWIENKRMGPAYYYSVEDKIYMGEVQKNRIQGKGKHIHLCGCQVQGQYEEDALEGKAMFTDLEGNEREGEWEDNNLVRWID